jgi:2-keto-4-pentenoate hydratase/2-oxohepta-3-ene-1,7-dioic acid hydratase in catechol pathway
LKLVTYVYRQATAYGVHLGESILDLALAAELAGWSLPRTGLAAFIAAGPSALDIARELIAQVERGGLAAALLPAKDVTLLAPIPKPAKNVFCVGRNYVDHVAEGYQARGEQLKLPEFAQFFSKPPTAVIGPNEAFFHDPKVTEKLDYEVELGIVIGARGRDIAPDKAFAHIFGYTIINDITARDLQRRHDQWFKGKGLDRSCPVGPWIVTADEIEEVGALELTCHVNGALRQRAQVKQMIFDLPTIIASLSAGMTLEPADLIATGTPSGVGYAMNPPCFLQAGDTVLCEISHLGQLSTPIAAA